jgi:general secretion pathway protein D
MLSSGRRARLVTAAGALLVALLMASCNTPQPAPTDAKEILTDAQVAPAPPDDEENPAGQARVNGRVIPETRPGAGAPVRGGGTGALVGRAGATHSVDTAGDVTLNYVDTDIREVVRVVLGDILKVNYTIDPSVQGTASIQTSRPLDKAQLLPTLQNLLAQNGAQIIVQNGLYRVAPVGNAGTVPPIVDGSSGTAGSQVLALRYASAKQLVGMLEPYVGEGGKIFADPARNVLVVSGSPAARSSLIDLIRLFDVDYLAGQSYTLFPVKSGTPDKLARDLQHALQAEAEGPLAGAIKVVPIEEANSVMVIAQQPAYLDHAERLMTQLDRVADTAGRNMHVYYLQNSQASDLQPILQRAFNPARSAASTDESASGSLPPTAEGTQLSSSAAPGSASGAPSSTSGAPGTSPPGGLASSSTGTGGTSTAPGGLGSTPSAGPTFPTEPGTAAVTAAANAPQIIADKKGNSLVIVATEDEYAKIEATIRRLDVLPMQVLIDATIAEVTLNHNLQYGTQFFLNSTAGSATLSNVSSSPLTLNPAAPITNASLFPGTLQNAFPGFALFGTLGSAQFAIQALQAVTDVRVISSPTLLVLNNEEARLQVGNIVPVITQSATSVVTAGAPVVNSVDYRETGVILTVSPRINSGGLVTLNLEQEVSSVIATTTSTINSPTFDERKVRTRVVVQDGQTIGLGGLISDSKTLSDSGIPILKDIPILGNLFSTKGDLLERTELLVLITPHVIHDQREARRLTDELRKKLTPGGLLLPGERKGTAPNLDLPPMSSGTCAQPPCNAAPKTSDAVGAGSPAPALAAAPIIPVKAAPLPAPTQPASADPAGLPNAAAPSADGAVFPAPAPKVKPAASSTPAPRLTAKSGPASWPPPIDDEAPPKSPASAGGSDVAMPAPVVPAKSGPASPPPSNDAAPPASIPAARIPTPLEDAASTVQDAKPDGPVETASAAESPKDVAANPPARARTVPPVAGPPVAGNGSWLQLAAVRKEEMAQVAWDKIKQQNTDLLGHSEPVIQQADLGPSKGVYYRLRIGPFASSQSANGLCSELKERQIACVIMHNEVPARASLVSAAEVH